MLKSMTGFGKDSYVIQGRTVTVEIRTLNSRQADLYLKTPLKYREKDVEIRTLLIDKLERGKIDISVTIDNMGDESAFSINKPLAKRYYEELMTLAGEMGITAGDDLFSVIVRLPEVVYPEKELLDTGEWEEVKAGIVAVAGLVDAFRIKEGAVLEKDIAMRIASILDFLGEIEKTEPTRTSHIREHLVKDLEQIMKEVKADKDRLEQEMIYYLEKLDITEEMVRLKKHCDYFRETLQLKGSQGRKLNFITQEMGREINTIGSKANDAVIQKLVVNMKDELEKIKEQLFNIL